MRIASVKSEPDGGAIITPVEPYCLPFKVSAEYVIEHQPKAGDVYIPQSLSRRERKRLIKAQNAERKANPAPVKPLTPEQIEAISLIARGFIQFVLAGLPVKDEFPAELDIKEVRE